MPVRQIRPQKSRDHHTLVQQLTAEWRQPNAAADEPVILEEFNNAGDLAHVYVVWSAWAPIDRVERGEVIMEAAEARYGKPNVADVTVTMGLTPVEADRMNISWQ